MANTDLGQAEADVLIAMEKQRIDDSWHDFPVLGGSLVVPLQSLDKREQFLLDIGQGRIALDKIKMQNRAREIVVLVRLDLTGPPHRNPDGVEIPCPHLHIFREGFGDKWAQPISPDRFPAPSDVSQTLEDFMEYCNITDPPNIQRGLFA